MNKNKLLNVPFVVSLCICLMGNGHSIFISYCHKAINTFLKVVSVKISPLKMTSQSHGLNYKNND